MTTILGASASGMVYHQSVLDIVGHNLANANAGGFRRSRIMSEGNPTPGGLPSANRLGVAETTADLVFSTGAALGSESPLHFTVNDDTFFRMTDLDGSSVLTRAGAISGDPGGNIIGPRGRLLDPPITIPQGTSLLAIDQFGIVSGIDTAGDRQALGQITLVRVMNPHGLEAIGDGLYRATVNSGPETEGTPGTPGFSALIPGTLEGSNTEMAEEFTQIIIAQRAYQANARTFKIGDEMIQAATNLTL